MQTSISQNNNLRSNILLALGVVVGIALAASGLLDSKNNLSLGEKAADVNGIAIMQSQLESITSAIANNKKQALTKEEYQFILQKLIDEELLVQRGQELGLLQLNSVLRNNMVQAVNASVVSENASLTPSDDELKKFYNENKNYFRPTSKIHFLHMNFSNKDQADIALQALADGKSFLDVKQQFSEKEIANIPSGLLSLATIRQYFGPSLTELITQLPIHEVSALIPSNNGQHTSWYLFYVFEKELAEIPNFEAIQDVVLNEFKRQQNEQTIHDYVLWLRKRASIETLSETELEKLMKRSL